MAYEAILLPGTILPKDLAYGPLIEALGDGVTARAKDLELYAAPEPPSEYRLEMEIDAVLREADEAGFDRFHLVGYSGGGAISVALAAAHPGRLRSLALLEPAWIGNEGRSESELQAWREFDRIRGLPPEEMMPRFVAAQLEPGVEAPAPPPQTPPWMASRPAGIAAITAAFERADLDHDALRTFDAPVYYALGALSNQGYYGSMATRLADLFGDFTLEVFEQRHHLDPPHRVEPDRVAASLLRIWARTDPS
jgi:pimeloyl-ACP methyl ester carboxylesterase